MLLWWELCSGFHHGGSKRRSYYPEQLLSDEPEFVIVHVWGGCGWGVIPTRGAAACRTAGGIIVIAPTMDTGRTGGLTILVTTIRIGSVGIGTATDR